MEARFVEFNEALMTLAQRLREGALGVAEFRSQRRQLLVALITPQASVSESGPPSVVPEIEKAKPRRGTLVAVLLLGLLLALALFGTLR